MRRTWDLCANSWTVSGWHPHLWRRGEVMGSDVTFHAEIAPMSVAVPGSIQNALREAGLLPDWNVGQTSRACEWVENRHWVYETVLPEPSPENTSRVYLSCHGLDGAGWVFIGDREVGRFRNTHIPHRFDLTDNLAISRRLRIIFETPPRWLGQMGWTSQMGISKPRFNYSWDWVPRLVQIGIHGRVELEVVDGPCLQRLDVRASVTEKASVDVRGKVTSAPAMTLRFTLERGGVAIRRAELDAGTFAGEGLHWTDLEVERWWPNGSGGQPLYGLLCELVDDRGTVHDRASHKIGFRSVAWRACAGAPAEADPWICAVNDEPVFLQGVNWTPILPNFADVSAEQLRQRLELYRDLGCNLLRVWGGASIESPTFYEICDELGLMVWQEFPLSSSGFENWPPDDRHSIAEMEDVARSYIGRIGHHACVILWCGGNELQVALDGSREGEGSPLGVADHPMLARLAHVCAQEDPARRFIPTSASGPRFLANPAEFGEGVHWDVHGPWRVAGDLETDWREFWDNHDALFVSEVGCPSASPVDIIESTRGDAPAMPPSFENALWRRHSWWIESHIFERLHGRAPRDLDEYVSWSQQRQARALSIAAEATKRRFPRCGGFLVWMGHDCFPCTANTAIVDAWGRPKPAAHALAEIFRRRFAGDED